MKTYWQLSVVSLVMAFLGIQSALGAVDATLKAKHAIIKMMDTTDPNQVDRAIAAFRQQYANNPELAWAMVHLSHQLERHNQTVRADALRQQVIRQYPGSEQAKACQLRFLQRDIVKQIQSKDYAGAAAAVKRLCKDFASHSALPWRLMEISEEWVRVNQLQQAAALWRMIAAGDKSILPVQQATMALLAQEMANLADRQRLAEANTRINAAKARQDVNNTILINYLARIAEGSLNDQQYEKAARISKFIIANWQPSEDDFWVRRLLVSACVSLGDTETAKAQVQELLAKHSQHPGIASDIRGIADQFYWKMNDYPNAKELYRQILTNWPSNSEDDLWTRKGLIITYLCLEDTQAVKVQMQELLAKYPQHPMIAKAVREIADQYFWDLKDYQAAKEFYQLILTNWPNYPEALSAMRGIASTAIKLSDFAAAKTATDRLVAEYAGQEDSIYAMLRVADLYREVKRYEEAIPLYRAVIGRWPGHADLIWAQQGLACSLIGLDNEKEADVAIENLMSAYAGHTSFVMAVRLLAENLMDLNQHDKALQLFQTILMQKAEPKELIIVHAGLARIYARQGQDEKVKAEADLILSSDKMNTVDNLGHYLILIAEEYYSAGQNTGDREQHVKSIKLFERLLPAIAQKKEYAAIAHYTIGLGYQQMEDYVRAADAFANSYQADPKFKYAAYCLYAQGRGYDEMIHRGQIPWDEGKKQMRLIFEKIVTVHPSTPEAVESQRWLDEHKID